MYQCGVCGWRDGEIEEQMGLSITVENAEDGTGLVKNRPHVEGEHISD